MRRRLVIRGIEDAIAILQRFDPSVEMLNLRLQPGDVLLLSVNLIVHARDFRLQMRDGFLKREQIFIHLIIIPPIATNIRIGRYILLKQYLTAV